MKYLVVAFDPNGRRLFTESAETRHGVEQVQAYAQELGAAEVITYVRED